MRLSPPIVALLISAGLALALPATAGTSALTPDQAKAVDQMIHDYLMNNPKVLAEALQHADETAKAAEAETAKALILSHKEDLERDPTSTVMGNPSGDVTIVEFFDYNCPYCKSSAPAVEQLLESDKRVRLVLKDYPVLGQNSVYAARIALVAAKHGKYADYYKATFAQGQKPTLDSSLAVAKSLGLDNALVRKEMESSDIDAVLKRNYDLGRLLDVEGTPTFIVGATTVPGAATADQLETLVAAARKGQS